MLFLPIILFSFSLDTQDLVTGKKFCDAILIDRKIKIIQMISMFEAVTFITV